MAKILIVGDAHFKDNYGHFTEFHDGRSEEREEIEKCIIDASKECETVVFLGDFFNAKTNSYTTISHAVRFLESFDKTKKIHIIAGNHESDASGYSALDFLGEIKNSNINIYTKLTKIEDKVGTLVFVPFLRKIDDVVNDKSLADRILIDIGLGNKAVFIHHTISGARLYNGIPTDDLKEVIINQDEIKSRSEKTFVGHIHKSMDFDGIHVVGAVMNESIGESDTKRILIWNTEDNGITEIKLPGRKLFRVIEPTDKELENMIHGKKIRGLAKIVTSRKIDSETLKKLAFEKIIVVETPKESRKRTVEVLADFSPTNLLKIYAEKRGINKDKLESGWKIVMKS